MEILVEGIKWRGYRLGVVDLRRGECLGVLKGEVEVGGEIYGLVRERGLGEVVKQDEVEVMVGGKWVSVEGSGYSGVVLKEIDVGELLGASKYYKEVGNIVEVKNLEGFYYWLARGICASPKELKVVDLRGVEGNIRLQHMYVVKGEVLYVVRDFSVLDAGRDRAFSQERLGVIIGVGVVSGEVRKVVYNSYKGSFGFGLSEIARSLYENRGYGEILKNLS